MMSLKPLDSIFNNIERQSFFSHSYRSLVGFLDEIVRPLSTNNKV